jgi:hypothetical protein
MISKGARLFSSASAGEVGRRRAMLGFNAVESSCLCRKLDSDVSVMKAAKNRIRSDSARPLNFAKLRASFSNERWVRVLL